VSPLMLLSGTSGQWAGLRTRPKPELHNILPCFGRLTLFFFLLTQRVPLIAWPDERGNSNS